MKNPLSSLWKRKAYTLKLVRKVLPVAQAFQPVQTGWRAGTPAPLTFSCFTGGPKVHE
jgi:hypothetical protein